MQSLRLSSRIPFVIRLGSTLSKESRKNENSSPNKNSNSEYLAADMYNYTPVSHYDIEVDIIKYRLPQPSANEPLKPPPPSAPAKK